MTEPYAPADEEYYTAERLAEKRALEGKETVGKNMKKRIIRKVGERPAAPLAGEGDGVDLLNRAVAALAIDAATSKSSTPTAPQPQVVVNMHQKEFPVLYQLLQIIKANEARRFWAHGLPFEDPDAYINLPRHPENLILRSVEPDCECATNCPHMRGMDKVFYLSAHLHKAETFEEILNNDPDHAVYVGVFNLGSSGSVSGTLPDVAFHYTDTNSVHVKRRVSTCTFEATIHPHDWMFHGFMPGTRLRSRLLAGDALVSIFELKLSDLTNHEELRDWHSGVVDGGFAGDLRLPKPPNDYDARTVYNSIELRGVSSWYGILVLHTREDRKVVVSKQIVGALASFIVGKPRSELTFQSVVQQSRKLHEHLKNLPEDMKAQTIIASAVLAFTQNVEFETEVQGAMLSRYWDKFRAHEFMLRWKPPFDLARRVKLVAGVVTAGYILYSLGVVQPSAPFVNLATSFRNRFYVVKYDPLSPPDENRTEWRPLWTPKERITLVKDLPKPIAFNKSAVDTQQMSMVFACSVVEPPANLLSVDWHNRLVKILAGATTTVATFIISWWTRAEALSPVEDVTYLVPGIPVPIVCDVEEPKYQVAPEAEDIVRVNPVRTTFTPRLMVVGVLFNDFLPYSYPSGHEKVEMSMLTSRIMIQTPEVDSAFFARTADEFDKLPIMRELLKPVEIDVPGWLLHYPGRKRAELTLALNSLLDNALAHRDAMASVFVKIEKSGYLRFDGPRLSTPRQIIARSTRWLAAVGPFFWSCGNRLKDVFHTTSPIFYGSTTSEKCGAALTYQMDCLGGPENCVFLVMDQSRLDAHERADALKREHERHVAMGMPQNIWWTDKLLNIPGYTVGGLKVNIVERRCTGDAKTSFANTVNSAHATHACIENLGDCWICNRTEAPLLGRDWFMNVNGDDVLVVMRKGVVCLMDLDDIKVTALRLGYRLKVQLEEDLVNASFCSRLYWPTRDGLVLGAKIGRWLTKAGVALENIHQLADYRSQMMGHYLDNAFVPLVSTYAAAMIRLIPSSNVRSFDVEDYKIHAERVHKPTEATEVFFCKRYGLTRAHIQDFESKILQLTQLPAIVQLSWLEDLVERDH